ncbi:RidA family protein [Sphingomonas sp.]|jgi:enamine deaminase RidA (YjgF/YER057c/UK114 family)|uniref:RidA family protein n=1 Tax=Sphingomonas sp. TaxID=28214 RepID=UPI002DE84C88|nr:RidA family protein [Sphingomonas sp.]
MTEHPQGRQNQEDWGYADAVVSGDMIYLSGVVAGQREGETVEASYTRTFERIAGILARAGASWDDVLEMTSYHTDLQSQMPAIVAVKKRFVKPPALAWTAIEITRLIPDRGITEIKVIARKSK